MSYTTLEVEFDHGRLTAKEPGAALPESGRGLLTILPPSPAAVPSPLRTRVQLPLIRGDGRRIINPTPAELDASLWD
ncbi:MAG: hypothetical protein HC841_01760 [Verrucomicrobiae bacterium]|nr:hypothetical protein [Verrucomicrobiae bacterium]